MNIRRDPLNRRQTLKLLAGTAATAGLAGCGVGPDIGPVPQLRTDLLMLRGKVSNLAGRDRDRLRAIAAFLDPANRSKVDLLSAYWLVDKPIALGKPGRAFTGNGLDMVVLARGESSDAVRNWAAQWAGVLDFDGDEAMPVAPVVSVPAPLPNAVPFLVFERVAGAAMLQDVTGADPGSVQIASHHILVNQRGVDSRGRQVLVVYASSRQAVHQWVEGWALGPKHAVEMLALTDLGEQLLCCARSPSHLQTAVLPTAWPQPSPDQGLQVTGYNPDGVYLTSDQKLGTYYVRHQITGQFLSVAGGGKVITVPVPSPGDRWSFAQGDAAHTSRDTGAGYYFLQHQGTGLYLNGDRSGQVRASITPQNWISGMTVNPQYSPVDSDGITWSWLAADPKAEGQVSLNTQGENWHQWDEYGHASALEQTITAIVKDTDYDASWPEDSYSGELLTAYQAIVALLHDEPKNGVVTTPQLVSVNDQVQSKFGGRLPASYATVFEHLYAELSAFENLRLWYGDGGHLATLLQETTTTQLDLINNVQSRAQPSPATNVNFLVATLFSAMSIALAATIPPPAGGIVAAVLAGAWRLYSASGGGKTDVLNTTFANLYDSLNRTFNALIDQREKTHRVMAGNWGKLSKFAGMIADGTLSWPDDTSQIRAVAGRQFEISVWQSVTEAIWASSGSGTENEQRIGRAVNSGHPWVYVVEAPILMTNAQKQVVPGFLHDVAWMDPDLNTAPDSLAKYLFDDASPGLGISITDFYLSRNGWAIPLTRW